MAQLATWSLVSSVQVQMKQNKELNQMNFNRNTSIIIIIIIRSFSQFILSRLNGILLALDGSTSLIVLAIVCLQVFPCIWDGPNRRRAAGLLYYVNLLTCGPSMSRLLNAARTTFGPPGICKWEGLCVYVPSMETKPQMAQLHRVKATLPECSATPFGDMKIPEPNIQVTKFGQFHEWYNENGLTNNVWNCYAT